VLHFLGRNPSFFFFRFFCSRSCFSLGFDGLDFGGFQWKKEVDCELPRNYGKLRLIVWRFE
jgi:hypothetical protein